MSFILLSLVFVLFSCRMPLSTEAAQYSINILPTFIGYLILWFQLEKRQINRRMRATHSVATGLLVLFFLEALAEIRFFFEEWLRQDGLIVGVVLNILALIFAQVTRITDAIGPLFTLLFLWALDQGLQERGKSVLFSRAGMILCGALAVFDVADQFLVLPFSSWTVTVPLGAAVMICAGLSLRGIPEME